jgi:hypothetical protein
LCRRCYDRPAIRDRYPSANKRGNRGPGIKGGVRRLPKPTSYAPGSLRKQVILRRRLRAGEELHHADDAKLPDDFDDATDFPDDDETID